MDTVKSKASKDGLHAHYGWVICLFCILLHFCSVGMVNTTLTVYMTQARDRLSLLNTQVTLMSTVRNLMTMLSMALALPLYRKITVRRGVFIALVSLSVGLIFLGLAQHVMVCYIGSGFLGITYALGGILPITYLINNWFTSRKATALAVCTIGSGICTMVLTSPLTILMEQWGIYPTLQAEAILVIVLAAFIYLFVRDTPASMNREAYLETGIAAQKEKKHGGTAYTPPSVLRLMMLCTLFVGFAGNSFVSYLMIHFVTAGFESTAAASAISFLGLAMLLGKFLFGASCDRLGTFVSNLLFLGAWIAGAFFTAFAHAPLQIFMYLAAFFNAFGIPVGSTGISIWPADLCSSETFAKSAQMGHTVFTVGALAGSIFPGIMADLTGSYAGAFAVYGILLIITLIIIEALYIATRKRSQTVETAAEVEKHAG